MGRSVLLVEDDNLVRSALAAGLTHHGFDVTAVGDARAAMNSFATTPPEVAVLDLHLGAGPTGLDLAVGMRERSPDLGLVLLTSFSDPHLLRATSTRSRRGDGTLVVVLVPQTPSLSG